jgi:hypothetical protein
MDKYTVSVTKNGSKYYYFNKKRVKGADVPSSIKSLLDKETTKDVSPPRSSPKKASPPRLSPKNVSPPKLSPKKVSPSKGSPKKESHDKATQMDDLHKKVELLIKEKNDYEKQVTNELLKERKKYEEELKDLRNDISYVNAHANIADLKYKDILKSNEKLQKEKVDCTNNIKKNDDAFNRLKERHDYVLKDYEGLLQEYNWVSNEYQKYLTKSEKDTKDLISISFYTKYISDLLLLLQLNENVQICGEDPKRKVVKDKKVSCIMLYKYQDERWIEEHKKILKYIETNQIFL